MMSVTTPADGEAGAPELLAITDAVVPLQETQDEVIARLAALTQPEFDRQCKAEAKALGIKVKTLEQLVRAARIQTADADRLPFAEVEPYPDPIDPASVLDEVVSILLRYVVLNQDQARAVALWIALTWFIEDVEVAALLIINAPERECGKSQLLTVVGYLSARPLPAANSTTSFLFRAITKWRPTLLIDEADTFIRENDELKGLVNAGHTRANAFVGRTVAVGDGHEPRLYDVWSAKSFAGIGLDRHLPDATMSRGIVIGMRRKLPHENVDRLRHADRRLFTVIAEKLARFADDYYAQVRANRPTLPDELGDRAQDNWEPLLAIAQCAGPAWVQRATEAALALSKSGETSVSTGNELLADIQTIFEQKQTAGKIIKISTVDLIAALVADEDQPWATYNRGKPLSPRQLARQLATYGIKPKTVRFPQDHTPKGYELADFQDAFARYLDPAEKLPQQRNAAPTETPKVGAVNVADGSKSDPQMELDQWAMKMLDGGGVADTNPDADGEY